MTGLIVAIDTPDLAIARRWVEAVSPHCGMVKIGLEFFAAHGPVGLATAEPAMVFLDLKLHDIPNTVAGAVSAILPARPRMLTLHAAGGVAMISAARRTAETAGERRPMLLAVTVLTSLSDEALEATGVLGDVRRQVLRLARLALDAGADGLVCAPGEVATLRDAFGATPILVVPGVRPAGSATGDQVRTATPREAAEAGADWVVVGRPITRAPDPAEAARAVGAELG